MVGFRPSRFFFFKINQMIRPILFSVISRMGETTKSSIYNDSLKCFNLVHITVLHFFTKRANVNVNVCPNFREKAVKTQIILAVVAY